MICEETVEDALVLCQSILFDLALGLSHEVIQTGDITTSLDLKLAVAIKPFYKKTVLFLSNRDALDANLIEHLTDCVQDARITERGRHESLPKILENVVSLLRVDYVVKLQQTVIRLGDVSTSYYTLR
jgi:hypothetical protein